MKRLLLLIFFYSYIIYPSYYIGGRITKFFLLLIYLLLFLILKNILPSQKPLVLSIPHIKWLALPFILGIICHLYFWFLPVPTGEDFHTYCGTPAMLLYKISIYLPHWILIILSIIALILSYIYIKGIGKKIWYIFFIIGSFVALFLIFFIPESITNVFHGKETVIMSIFRHPPIPKTLYLLGYLFFGINEYVGRAIQFFFLCLTGIYIGKIVKLIGGKDDAFSTIACFSITIFFPTFFHLTNFCGLAPGELFFTAFSLYYFLSFLSDEKEENLFCSMSILGIGLLYERKILFLLLFFLLVLLIKRKISLSVLKYSLIPLIFGLPFIFVSYQYRDAPLTFYWIKDPSLIFLGAKNIFISLGGIITFSIIASLFFIKKHKILLLSFFILYYLFVSSIGSIIFYIRHAQPYYLILAIFLSCLVCQRRILFLPILIIMLYQSILSPSPLLFNLSNYKSKEWTATFGILPYKETISYVKYNLPDARIYAPMYCEPTHFYLSKFKFEWENWIRKPIPLKNITIDALYKFCKEEKIDYLVLPIEADKEYLEEVLDLNLVKEIYEPNMYFKLKKTFFFGENFLFLAKVKP